MGRSKGRTNQRVARLKVGGGRGPGPSHSPGTRSSGLPPLLTELSILAVTALGSRAPARDRRALPYSVRREQRSGPRELEIEYAEGGRDSCRFTDC